MFDTPFGKVGLADAVQQADVGLGACTGAAAQPVVVAAGAHLERFTLAANREFGLICLHEFVDGVNVFSLLPANQAVAFAKMSCSI